MEELKQSIIRIDQDLADSSTRVKEARADLKDYVVGMDEHKEVQRLIGELKAAKIILKNQLMADADYNAKKSELEELKFKHRDLKDILSNHLVQFRLTNEEDRIVSDNVQKPIILNGKLGKPEAENIRMEFSQ